MGKNNNRRREFTLGLQWYFWEGRKNEQNVRLSKEQKEKEKELRKAEPRHLVWQH